MKNPNKTEFNKDQISSWTLSRFTKWWKDHDFDGDASTWYYKITGKKKPKE